MSTTQWTVFSRKCGVVSLHDTKEEAERMSARLSFTPFYPDERLGVMPPMKSRTALRRDTAPLAEAAE